MLFTNTLFRRIRVFNQSLVVIIAFFAMSTAACAAAPPLLAYWDFNNPRGGAIDTIAGHIGTLLGGAAFTADAGGRTGVLGDRAMDFLPPGGETDIDNKREQVLVSNATFLNTGSNSVTYSVWAQTAPNARKFFQVFQAKNQGGEWGIAAGLSGSPAIRDISFTVADEYDTVRVEPHDFGQWSHLAFVKNGDTRQIWLDGMKVLEQDRPEVLPTDFTLLSIGSFRQGNFSFQGKLDDFAIFDGALTAEQIGRLAAGESALTVALPELAGDYDDSGQVAQGDLDLVLLNWGKTIPADPVPAGWVNEQPMGLIGQSALDRVLLNWGNTAGSGTALGAAASVPEPTSVVLSLFAAFGVAGFRRHSRRSAQRSAQLSANDLHRS